METLKETHAEVYGDGKGPPMLWEALETQQPKPRKKKKRKLSQSNNKNTAEEAE